jgi:hypothetical protein
METGDAKMESFTITAARYAKGKALVRPRKDGDWMTAEARMAEAKGRYSHRERGYVMSFGVAEKMIRQFSEGYRADCLGKVHAPEVVQ